MKKLIVNPCVCKTMFTHKSQAFAEIVFEEGKLSICGVVGPMSNGDCRGSAGQCVEEIRIGEPNPEWTREMLDKFCDIWERWHLNDMKPYCQHMKELGWDEQAKERVKIDTWTLTKEAMQKKRDAENRALECLRNGQVFRPTKDETVYARMKHSLISYNEEDVSYYYGKLYRDAYELKEKDCLGRPTTEYKTRGWIRYDECDLGFIGRPCPVCGYGYGTSWIKEEVPEEVIEWLFSLPETKIRPAWV